MVMNLYLLDKLKVWGKERDVLLGISTSGSSLNVINAVVKAKEMGLNNYRVDGANWW